MKQKHLKTLLEKPMDRKQFLAHVGAGALAIVGVSGLLKTLVNFGDSRPVRTEGYGSSAYGGNSKQG